MEINTRPDCPVARSADIIADRWTLLILRNLSLDGPQRFQDFAKALDGISPTTLSARLKSLQEHGLIAREVIDTHPPRTLYALTDLGLNVRPVLKALHQFGSALPGKPENS